MNYTDISEAARMAQNLFAQNRWMTATGTVITAIAAVCALFWGYKLLKFWIGLIGFLIGAMLGAVAGILLKADTPVLIGTVLAAGVIFASLAFFFYKMGIFLVVAVNGYGIASTLLKSLDGDKKLWWVILVCAAVGIGCGILATVFVRPVVIVLTAFGGASALAFTICPMLGLESFAISAIVMAVLAVLGILWQFKVVRGS